MADSFWTVATDVSVARRAGKIALIVGTVLMAINYGDHILKGDMDIRAILKCLATYLVPYCVSTYSSVMAVRDRTQTLEPDA
ncbi:nitrate/nitrite transporter NrtS [Ascidiaceihabitans sp.]|uniref:nitrate/nitrite transporter NrtS n=1 Tax=Ascidiaceihabitans sp. TaxID=1872644 RepID=UPI003297BD49